MEENGMVKVVDKEGNRVGVLEYKLGYGLVDVKD